MRMYRSRNKRVRREKEPFSKITYIDENGYLRWISSDRLVHRDIAYHKIYKKNRNMYPLPFWYYQIHHINGNKLDNRPENLMILTENDHRVIHNIEEEETYEIQKVVFFFFLSIIFFLFIVF